MVRQVQVEFLHQPSPLLEGVCWLPCLGGQDDLQWTRRGLYVPALKECEWTGINEREGYSE